MTGKYQNEFGKRLLAVCQDASLLILNGRTIGDEHGQLTCHTHMGSSLVDYFLASPAIFSLQNHLEIKPLPPDSDHCPLHLRIPLKPTSNDDMHTNSATLRKLQQPKYKPNKISTFRALLADTLRSKLNHDTPCYASTMSECIASAAAQVHGFCGKPHGNRHHQPW